MKLIIGSDHGGFELKEQIRKHLSDQGHDMVDMGTFDEKSVDYPNIAEAVAKKVLEEETLGLLFCGTGIGVSIAANKVKGIRAALCSEEFSARMARNHNNANILCMGGRTTGVELAKSIAEAFLKEDFLGDRHERRVQQICALEEHV